MRGSIFYLHLSRKSCLSFISLSSMGNVKAAYRQNTKSNHFPSSALLVARKYTLPGNRLQNNMAAQKRAAPFKDQPAYTEDELLLLGGYPSHTGSLPEKGSTTFVGRSRGLRAGSVPSDFDLLSATMKRIGELERCIHGQEHTLQKKDQEIAALEDKIKRLQRHKTENPVQVKEELEIKCQKLQQRVNEMEQFLRDYGLEWIGEHDSSVVPQQNTTRTIQGHSSTKFQPDFDLILQNLQDLNILGGEGKSHIEYRQGGARLRSPEPVPLTLFINGILMFNGPFRPYKDPSTQQCIKDIMDGYFPSELQKRFPDGVTFQVTDKRNVLFRERRSWDEFPGLGQTVGRTEETSELPGPQLSVDQFLNKLPKSVVRGGQIVEIRGPIKEALQESLSEEKLKEIQVDSPLVATGKIRSEQTTAISTLRIKSENGEHTYKVRMLQSETLGDLRSYLSQYRDSHLNSYDVISSFPHRVYDDDSCTLQELGFVPNAFLLLRPKSLAAPGGENIPYTNTCS